jgi:hypothetical protein
MGDVSFKVIVPKKLRNFHTPYVNAMAKIGKLMKADLQKTTKTWKGDTPIFDTEIELDQENIPFLGQFPRKFTLKAHSKKTGDKGYWKWRWLDEGTRVRYALMMKGFRAKTRVGELNSWAGAKGPVLMKNGRPVLLMNNPRPGIKKRKWTQTLQKKYKKKFATEMKRANKEAVRLSGHAVR